MKTKTMIGMMLPVLAMGLLSGCACSPVGECDTSCAPVAECPAPVRVIRSCPAPIVQERLETTCPSRCY